MKVEDITNIIEEFAPLSLQESYDNAGLILGSPDLEVRGCLLCLDVTEKVVEEAIQNNLNLIISHHPLIFNGLKKITGKDDVQRAVILAIRNNIAVYAAHTNLDHVISGVNGIIADKLRLINRSILRPLKGQLMKLITFVPQLHIEQVREALFAAGAGNIGNYDACSFNSEGYGTFRANGDAKPFVGEKDKLHFENEIRIEVIFPRTVRQEVVTALIKSHPYEEPAFDLIVLENQWNEVGAGIVGDLEESISSLEFLQILKSIFGIKSIKFTEIVKDKIRRVALCGGSGSFLLNDAVESGADIYISADFKYHEYFAAAGKIIIADPGHFEMEQFTKEIFYEIIRKKFPTFAVRISDINTNPILYL